MNPTMPLSPQRPYVVQADTTLDAELRCLSCRLLTFLCCTLSFADHVKSSFAVPYHTILQDTRRCSIFSVPSCSSSSFVFIQISCIMKPDRQLFRDPARAGMKCEGVGAWGQAATAQDAGQATPTRTIPSQQSSQRRTLQETDNGECHQDQVSAFESLVVHFK